MAKAREKGRLVVHANSPLDLPKIVARMKQLKVKNNVLAEKLGVSEGIVSRWLNGGVPCDQKYWRTMASVLQWSMADMLQKDAFPAYNRGDLLLPLVTGADLKNVRRGQLRTFLLAWGGLTRMLLAGEETCFGFLLEDRSINRAVPVGSILTVDAAQDTPTAGKLYLLKSPRGICPRRFTDQGGPPRFEPDTTEPGYHTVFLAEDVEVLGRILTYEGAAI